jgi:hypothetical protein
LQSASDWQIRQEISQSRGGNNQQDVQKSQDKKDSGEPRVIDGKTRLLGRGFVIEFRFSYPLIIVARPTHPRFSRSVPS